MAYTGSRLIASCAVNADRCRSVASDTAKGIRVQRMASTSSNAPSGHRRQDDARAIRGREWRDRRHQQESRTKLEPGHGHRIVMAQVTLVERVEQRGERRGDHAHPEAQMHRPGNAADHQRHARNHQDAEQKIMSFEARARDPGSMSAVTAGASAMRGGRHRGVRQLHRAVERQPVQRHHAADAGVDRRSVAAGSSRSAAPHAREAAPAPA